MGQLSTTEDAEDTEDNNRYFRLARRAMKRPTVFLGEMTNPEVEAFLKTGHTVIVPTGATEQHGPHAPLLTDVLIPQEIARRVASEIRAVVAPPINYALSYPHVGFTGLVHIRIPTFMALIEDLCVAFSTAGFKRIVFLNGHYDNTYAIAYGCAMAADRIGKDVKAFPVNYWDGLTAAEAAEFSGLKNGLHANAAETSAILAIDPNLVDIERANAEFPPFPEFTVNTAPVHTAFFFTSPGSVYWATKSGTWGDARKASAEIGERYIQIGVRSTLDVLKNIEKTFEAMPPRK
jgi:creatinine amidohydrolase